MTTYAPAHRRDTLRLAAGTRWLRAPLALVLSVTLALTAMPAPAGAADEDLSLAAGDEGALEGDDGVVYARDGGIVELTVDAPSDTKCIVVSGAHSDQESGGNLPLPHTFELTAADGDGTRTVEVRISDNSGCQSNLTAFGQASYELDNTAPNVTGTLGEDNLGDNGWHTGDVTVSWDCDDDGVGIAPGACSGDTTVGGEGDSLSATSDSVADRLGNNGHGTVTGIRIDRTAPLTTADAVSGWSASDVTIELDADDALSGVARTRYRYRVGEDGDWQSADGAGWGTYDGSLHFEDEGSYELEFYSVDKAGNEEEPAESVTFGIDKTSPTITTSQDPEANSAGWNNEDVTVSFDCADEVSAVVSCTDPKTVTGEVEDHAVEGTAVDEAGNDNTVTHHVSIDRTAPTVTASVSGETGDDGWHTGPVTVTYRCDDPFSEGVASGIPSGSCPDDQLLADDGEDQSTDPVSATDAAGNTSDDLTVDGIDIDQTDPETTASGLPGDWVNEAVTVTLDAGDHGGSGVRETNYRINGGAAIAYEGSIELDEDGVHSVTYWSVDVAGNSETAQQATVSIDTAAPASAVTLSEDGWTNQPVTVTLSADDEEGGSGVDVIRYRLGDGDAQDYDEAFDVTEHGEHTLTFWSVDHAGNVEEEQTASILIDTVDPTLTGQALDANIGDNGWYVGDITVEWDCSDDDSGIDGDCPDDTVLTDEGDDLEASAYVYDNAGNRTDASVGPLKLDRTAPSTQASAPDGWQNDDVTVELTASDEVSGVATTTYTIDGGAEQTSAHTGDPVEVTFTEDGTYTLEFWSTDVAGNVEESGEVEVKVDQTVPTITSSQDPEANDAGWNNTDVTVSFECDDETSGIASCTDPVTVTDEVEDHDVEGEAVDNAGNSATTTHTVSIDKTAPVVTSSVDGPEGDGGWFVGPVTVDFECEDPESGGVASGIPGGTCPESQTLSDDGASQSTSSVTVTDRAGNESDSHTRGGIDIDQTPPETTASGVPEDWTNETVTVELSAEDDVSGVARTEYKIGDGDYQTYDGEITFGVEGAHTLHYRSVDEAGNAESANTAEIRIDETAPATTASGLPAADWTNASVTVELTATDDGSEVAATYYRVGDGDAQTYEEPFELSDEGVHELTYWSVDNAGNIEGDNEATVRIDKTAPETTSDAPSGWQTETVTIELTATDSGSGIAQTSYRIGEGADREYNEPFNLAEGVHDLAFWSTDAAGNVEEEQTATVRVDLSAPALDVTSPADGSSTSAASVDVRGTATDDTSGVAGVTVNGEAATLDGQSGEFSLDGVALECGPNTLTVEAVDEAGLTDTDEVGVDRRCASVTSIDRPLQASEAGDVRANGIRGNRVVPVKVELEYLDEAYTGPDAALGNPTISLRQLADCNSEEVAEVTADSVGNANTGDAFRWADGKWVYNLSSRNLESGACYRVDVELDGARASGDLWAVLEIK